MKISKDTIFLLKNFACINKNMMFRKGNVISTTLDSRVFARAEIPDEFPTDFPIYDLNKLLSVLTLFDEPNVEFEEKYLLVTSGNTEIKYVYSSERVIDFPEKSKVKMPELFLSFKLTEKDIESLYDSAKILKLPEFIMSGDGSKVIIGAGDSGNASACSSAFDVGVNTRHNFKVIMGSKDIVLLQGDYTVGLASIGPKRNFIHFKHNDAEVDYWVASKINSMVELRS